MEHEEWKAKPPSTRQPKTTGQDVVARKLAMAHAAEAKSVKLLMSSGPRQLHRDTLWKQTKMIEMRCWELETRAPSENVMTPWQS